MPAFFQNGVLNEGNTPAAKTGTLAARQSAGTVAEGTIYIAYDTQEIFSAQGGSWVKVSGSGGGGSQNLDQVLAVGNTGINKSINLYDVAISPQQILVLRNNIAENAIFIEKFQGNEDYRIFIFNDFINQAQLFRFTLVPTSNPNIFTELDYSNDINGKNQFYVRAFDGNINKFRRFVVNASYSGGNTVELRDQLGTQSSSITQEADNNIFQSTIRVSIADSNAGLSQYTEINNFGFVFQDTQNGNFLTNVTPSFAGNTLQIYFPEYSGVMANVNELVRATGIDLSAGNYDCANYGVYQIDVGDNVRVFDLTNFVSNGADGQFVTICAADIPVKCFNSAGNIFGTANINSKGLFKLMKIGNDIYSSHL